MYLKSLLLTLVIFLICSCSLFAQSTSKNPPVVKGSYLGQVPPGLTAKMFALGIASTGLHDDMGPAFSPDGKEVFFRIAGNPYGIITTMRQIKGVWSKPDLAFWSGQYADGFVYFSQDGNKLYIGSKRPEDGSTEPAKRSNIWEVSRTETGYGAPRKLDPLISKDETEYMAGLSAKGNFFINQRVSIDRYTTFDLYSCQLQNGQFINPQKIDLKIEPKYMTFGGAVDPDEKYMIVSIRNMEDSFGSDDLYVSFHNDDGTWGTPIHLGENVNSAGSDSWPRISPDGKYMFFVSWRYTGEKYSEIPVTYNEIMAKKHGAGYGWGADIYWVSSKAITDLKPKSSK